VLVNLGGEPERDDSGLPRVDIVVPDDARELDRDVQAYHRELRALRRQERRMRLHGPLTRDGVVLPLLASCLVLALIAGVLVTLFTAAPLPGSGPDGGLPLGSGAPRDSLVARPSRSALPATATVDIYGAAIPLSQLTRSVLALVPVSCDCATALARLAGEARAAGVPVYLIGGGALAPVTDVQAEADKASAGAAVAGDTSGVLARTYLSHGRPPAGGPTALLVTSGGAVAVTRPLPPVFELGGQIRSLAAG
jgi:hypothetical protein